MAKEITIGLGITTFNRPHYLDRCMEHIEKFTKSHYKLHIAIDSNEDRKGIAFRKNECLKELKDCDYIFLFDDDTYPIKEGWEEYFIKNCKGNHLLYMTPRLHGKPEEIGNFYKFGNCGGVFMMMTKEHVLRIGAFNEGFGFYGFEHADYSERIYGGRREYLMLKDTPNYIYASDYDNNSTVSSLPVIEKQQAIMKAAQLYYSNNRRLYIPL